MGGADSDSGGSGVVHGQHLLGLMGDAEAAGEKERRKTPAMVRIVAAIVMLQAMIRRQLARRAVRANASAQGMLLAMPGTAQGRSGNYEYDADGQVLIAEFDVVDGEWVMRHEPMEKRAWLKARGV
jgi:hypothetical protein